MKSEKRIESLCACPFCGSPAEATIYKKSLDADLYPFEDRPFPELQYFYSGRFDAKCTRCFARMDIGWHGFAKNIEDADIAHETFIKESKEKWNARVNNV